MVVFAQVPRMPRGRRMETIWSEARAEGTRRRRTTAVVVVTARHVPHNSHIQKPDCGNIPYS